ncbi:hypothetical protein ACWF50_20205 [Brucella pseudogrignonensis]|jgi:CO dehydrogenase nickel-insertion accessory protein CooC1
MKISLVGQKGGVGKTVLSQLLVNAILAKEDAVVSCLLIRTRNFHLQPIIIVQSPDIQSWNSA